MTTAPFRMRSAWTMLVAAMAIGLSSCHTAGTAPAPDQAGGNWPLHGRLGDGSRYSPDNGINADNVGKLGLAWSYKIFPDRGLESTPIVIDGVMYVTGPYSKVFALDAKTGKELWTYDPEVDAGITGRGCCGPVNRGVAVSGGKVFVGVFDGRLVALDQKTGKVAWSVDTLIDHKRNYTITGAPLIAKGKVLIGNGGAEYGVRGYVTAYDIATGKQAWRFFTVPAGPDAPDAKSRAMQIAAATWEGTDYVAQGGGGTVWDSMLYDPDLDLIYIGVGNGSLWSRKLRSQGKGDNLYLSSIVALRPDSGDYVWHYQTTPGDEWDYTATQNMIMADLQIDGKPRKVIMQAPKNGFFYVIDRTDGTLISAKNFVPVNWAKGIDSKTGRPIIDEKAVRYEDGQMKFVTPAMIGAHNWQPMAYSPKTGLVYIPAQLTAVYFQTLGDPKLPKELGQLAMGIGAQLGVAPSPDGPAPTGEGAVPDIRKEADRKRIADSWRGRLIAWDPVHQKMVWAKDYPTIWNGGLLATGGDIVFQGTADGRFVAYRASDGQELWQSPVGTGIIAPPISYRIGNDQYIAIAAGWGGSFPLALGALAREAKVHADAKILVYKLGGTQKVPMGAAPERKLEALPQSGTADDISAGRIHFAIHCIICHGFEAINGAGVTPDLRTMARSTYDAFPEIVKGAFKTNGMPDFSAKLDDRQIEQIRQYLASRNAELRRDPTGP